MNKKTTTAFGKKIYLLGQNRDGINYWIEEGTWECDWYWSFGHVQTYTYNRSPENSRYLATLQHFNNLFFKGPECCIDELNKFFYKMPLDKNEKWDLLELMKSFYIMSEYSILLYSKGAHITENPCKDILQNDEEYERINKQVIPKIIEEVYKLLSPQI